jgi:hypothetical protein
MRNYKITIMEEHMKMEKVNKERLLDRLSKLNDEVPNTNMVSHTTKILSFSNIPS